MASLKNIFHILFPVKETAPARAYDLWAGQYDDQPDNLMLDLDEKLVSSMLSKTDIQSRNVVDVGCGTGRHWPKIIDKSPARLAGYDVSAGMLQVLRQKFPSAETHLLTNNRLEEKNASCDVLISTLTMAHIENMEQALEEWNRVIKPGGTILITDYHPDILSKGGQRTFHHGGKTVAVKNHIHPVEKILAATAKLHWQTVNLEEWKLDDSMKGWYEKQNAVHVFEKFKGNGLIYGLHLKKSDAAA